MRLLSSLTLLLIAGCLNGCAMTPQANPRDFGQVAQALTVSMTDQVAWESLMGNVRGHIMEPGIEGYAGVLYIAGGRLKGVDGDVSISGQGTATGEISDAARARILELLKTNPDLAREYLESLSTTYREIQPMDPVEGAGAGNAGSAGGDLPSEQVASESGNLSTDDQTHGRRRRCPPAQHPVRLRWPAFPLSFLPVQREPADNRWRPIRWRGYRAS